MLKKMPSKTLMSILKKLRPLRRRKRITKEVPPELLLAIFKELDSKDMVKMMRVCSGWYEIICGNKNLWRRLILPEKARGWSPSVVELFDERSESSLKEIWMEIDLPYAKEHSDSLMDVLTRSKGILQQLHIFATHYMQIMPLSHLSDLSWRIPNLVDCIIVLRSRISTRLIYKSQTGRNPTGLRTLWIPSAKSLFQNGRHLISSVASLHVEEYFPSQQWMEILRNPSQTLKDLYFKVGAASDDGFSGRHFILDFPKLKLLTIDSQDGRFPHWMMIPTSSTLVNLSSELLRSLPSVTTLWALNLDNFQMLEFSCPILRDLRVHAYSRSDEFYAALSLMLRNRKRMVETGEERDGIQMVHLKRLFIYFDILTRNQISELRALVQEITDLSSIEWSIEVEI